GTVLTSGNYDSTLDIVYVNVGESPAAGDIGGSFSGGLIVNADSVALTTDTTGNYVATITNGSGISGSSSTEGGTPTIALGNLTADWNQTGAFDLVLNNTSSELRILGSAGSFFGSFDPGALTANRDYNFPNASGTVITTGNLTEITTVGTITAGTWNGTALADAYVADAITISSAGTVDWAALSNYPAACAAGSAITQIADT